MGHWLIAQCDVYSPAASAAKVAFEKAFPPSKQPEALVFCKDEILTVSIPVCVTILKSQYCFISLESTNILVLEFYVLLFLVLLIWVLL